MNPGPGCDLGDPCLFDADGFYLSECRGEHGALKIYAADLWFLLGRHLPIIAN
ncbi:Uncharacterised protein [Mycobacteroides abscessus subsp. abscessus]|nr:Uncharacterised protein [Mycobacteroides abscessus subsp. abscessus]SIL75527.1 Uncharacterised protein [Mycobacteroides abscessus subsp. abscessus]